MTTDSERRTLVAALVLHAITRRGGLDRDHAVTKAIDLTDRLLARLDETNHDRLQRNSDGTGRQP